MTFRILGGTMLALWTVAAAGALGAQETKAPQSVLDGVYTEEQAKRGEAVYAETCATCHGASLAGGEMAPALVGPDFIAGWKPQTVNDLFERVRLDMPQDNPGILTPQQTADVVSFLLSAGKYPAGTSELPKENDALKTIKLEAPK